MAVIILSVGIISFLSCKKDRDNEPGQDKFPLTNLTVNITSKMNYPNSNSVIVAYEVKNVSASDYSLEKYVLNPVKVRASIVSTDGTTYEATLFVSNVKAGTAVAMEQVVAYAAGKTVDLTKTKAELTY